MPSHGRQFVDADVGQVELQQALRNTAHRSRREVPVSVDETLVLQSPRAITARHIPPQHRFDESSLLGRSSAPE